MIRRYRAFKRKATRAASVLPRFEDSDAPGERMWISGIRVEVDGEVRAENLVGERIRFYPGAGCREIVVRSDRYRPVILERFYVAPHVEVRTAVRLERDD